MIELNVIELDENLFWTVVRLKLTEHLEKMHFANISHSIS